MSYKSETPYWQIQIAVMRFLFRCVELSSKFFLGEQ